MQGQMYVEHLKPASSTEPQPFPMIFIHGGTRTGAVSLTKRGRGDVSVGPPLDPPD